MLQLHHGRRRRGLLTSQFDLYPVRASKNSVYVLWFLLPAACFLFPSPSPLMLLLLPPHGPFEKDGNMHQLCPTCTTAQGWTIKSLCKFILLRMFQSITLLMQHIGLGWVLWLDKRIPQNINMLFSYCRMSRCVECLSLVPSCMTLS